MKGFKRIFFTRTLQMSRPNGASALPVDMTLVGVGVGVNVGVGVSVGVGMGVGDDIGTTTPPPPPPPPFEGPDESLQSYWLGIFNGFCVGVADIFTGMVAFDAVVVFCVATGVIAFVGITVGIVV